ncbi:MAG: hypothetical protein R3C20_01660 [Planctomycetaceae bacterium]
MPARVVHCRTCRALLNSELTEDSVEIPKFVPLPELVVIAAAPPRGHYVECPGCHEELRIHVKYQGQKVQCKHCEQAFRYDDSVKIIAMYTQCPHCAKELRAAMKHVGTRVGCRFCAGHIELLKTPQ